jgi:hypothetical protein
MFPSWLWNVCLYKKRVEKEMKISEMKTSWDTIPTFILKLCQQCKYYECDFKEEPCKSCEITNFEKNKGRR